MMPSYAEMFPMFIAKLLKLIIIKVPLGIAPPDKIYASFLHSLFERTNLYLVDFYVPEYESNVNQLRKHDQLRYPEKLLPAAPFLILEDGFKTTKDVYERENIVGYIGGYREVKGIINFVKAIRLILERKDNNVRFLIAGDGILRDQIRKMVRECPQDRVNLMDWIPHEKLPKYLNELKLLVIPSYSEGAPNIAIEAMTCGTPILSTNVGAIPLLIRKSETGFILENNSPEHIAEKIIQVLNNGDPLLQKVAENARSLINERYRFSVTVETWSRVLAQTIR